MRSAVVWVFVGLVGCTKVGASQDPSEPPDEQQQFAQPPGAKLPPPSTGTPPMTAATKVTILMTSATLADDCGTPPPAKAKGATWAKDEQAAKADTADTNRKSQRQRKRSCEQSSMQLSVKSDASGGAATLAVKKVELFDDQGKLLGELTPRDPGVWAPDGSSYNAWDQRVAPGTELSVSYALSQPPWGTVTERWNRTYVLKAVVTVGGTDQAVQHEVHIEAPTFLPPNVKT